MFIIEKSVRPKIIAIDFDETICDNGFPNIQTATLKASADFYINKLYDEGYYIIIWTCRYLPNHIQDCKNFLNEHNIKYHKINENYPGLEFKPTPKIYYDILIDDKCFMNIDWKWIYRYIKVKFTESKLFTITEAMKEQFFYRTKNHIELAGRFLNKYYNKKGCRPRCIRQAHDILKFEEEELAAYIAITWNYYCKDNYIDFPEFESLKSYTNKATNHHVKNSEHHPEYWSSDRRDNFIPTNDRDKFDPNAIPTINCESMPIHNIDEMCADWCAMSLERGNTPFEWADSVINSRWSFGEERTTYIYKVLNLMWDK